MLPSCCAPRHCHYHLITRFGWLGLTVQVLFALEKQDLDTVDLDDFDDMDRAIRKDQQVAFDGQFYTRTMWYRTFTRSFPHLSVAWCYPGGLLLRRQKARQVPRRSLPPKLYMICAPIHPMRQRNATKQQNVSKCNKIQQTLHFKPEDWTCGYDGISDDIMIYYGHHTFVFDRELGALSRSEFVGLQSHFWAPTNAAHMRTEHWRFRGSKAVAVPLRLFKKVVMSNVKGVEAACELLMWEPSAVTMFVYV